MDENFDGGLTYLNQDLDLGAGLQDCVGDQFAKDEQDIATKIIEAPLQEPSFDCATSHRSRNHLRVEGHGPPKARDLILPFDGYPLLLQPDGLGKV